MRASWHLQELMMVRILSCMVFAVQVPAATMASHLEGMVIATRGSRERARSQKAKYAQIAAQYMEEVGRDAMPGYIGNGGATSEWSDGFNVRVARRSVFAMAQYA